MTESTIEQLKPTSRFVLSSIVLAVLSGVLWFVIQGPLPVNIDYIDPNGYTYLVAAISGVVAGLISMVIAVNRRINGLPFSTSVSLALLFGLPALGWNAYFLWIFFSWVVNCGEGPCY